MILLIEPSKELSTIIKKSLKNNSHEVATARSAEEAILKADKSRPSLVIIELLMPRHNGLEFIYEFRSYQDWFDVPIIIYSQISAEELGLTNSLAQEMGIIAHLYKPTTTLENLLGQVDQALAR